MMDYGGLVTLGAGLIGGATAPKRPKIDPYEPQLLEERSTTCLKVNYHKA